MSIGVTAIVLGVTVAVVATGQEHVEPAPRPSAVYTTGSEPVLVPELEPRPTPHVFTPGEATASQQRDATRPPPRTSTKAPVPVWPTIGPFPWPWPWMR